jgi:uncharacterized protein (TIGR03437 family)
VVLTVSSPKAALLLDREILVFETIEGSTRSLPQSLHIHNTGTSDLEWEIVTPQDGGWARASATRGTVRPGREPVESSISVDPSGLRAGNYYTTLTVRASGALGSPQLLSVRLKVLPSDSKAAPVLERTGLVFRGSPGQDLPEQTIELGSTGGRLSFAASTNFEQGSGWLEASPDNGTIVSSSQRTTLRFQVNSQGLAEGVYRATVDFAFSDGSAQQVAIVLILSSGASASPARRGARSAECAPSKQVMVTTSLGNNFSGSTGWPIILRTEVYDDCGTPVGDSTLTATFSNNDPPKTFTSLRNGQYTTTWTPRGPVDTVTVTLLAKHPVLPNADLKMGGRLGSEANPPPVLFHGGVLNAASRRNSSLMAPNAVMSLTGSFFPSNPEEVSVVVNGSQASVLSSSSGEIRIVAPQDFGESSRAAVIVRARGIATAPEVLTVVTADPGLFPPEGELTAAVGDTLTVTGTGLGAVAEDGSVRVAVSAKFDDTDAVVTSAVAAPDSPGVYSLKIAVPSVASGKRQLTITQNGIASNAIPVTVQ